MKRILFACLAGLVLAGGLAGCRMPGESGYIEISPAEYRELESFARGIIVKNRQALVIHRDKLAYPGMTKDIREFILTEPPDVKINYDGDLHGSISFAWLYDDWSYRAEAKGNLGGNPADLGWTMVRGMPPKLKDGSAGELWRGQDPSIMEIYDNVDYFYNQDTLLYDLRRDQGRDILVEGAEAAPAAPADGNH